jgi:hypothetical protein
MVTSIFIPVSVEIEVGSNVSIRKREFWLQEETGCALDNK